MLPVVTKQDLKEAAAIERRRKLEEERKTRIFNPRVRTIGVDCESLGKQVEERSHKERDEAATTRAWDEQAILNAKYATLLEKKLDVEKRAVNEEINRFYATYQQKQFRREFDLYDPDALKKQLPARIDDDDPRCGVSSGQKFHGEDLECKARLKYQQNQFRSWVEQQRKEKERADSQRNAYEDECHNILMARDERAVQLEQIQNDVKRKMNEAFLRFNMAQAEENSNRQQLEQYREHEMNNTEMYNATSGDFLTENPEMQVSALGSHRVIPYMYKGMSDQQVLEIRKKQQEQIQQRKLQEERIASWEAEWDQLLNAMRDQACLLEAKVEQDRRKLNTSLLKQNLQLAIEQKSHQDYIKKYVYTNEPTPLYFEQFNTSTR